MALKKRYIALLILASIYITNCGYHIAGKGSNLPPEVKSIAILILANNTQESNLEQIVTEAIRNEFIRSKRLKVVSEDEADVILYGNIKSFDLSAVSFDKNDVVMEYRAEMVLDLSLKKKDDNSILWKDNNLSIIDEYGAEDSVIVTSSPEYKERNLNVDDLRNMTRNVVLEEDKKYAIIRIAKDVAERVHNGVFTGF
jgi:outer membrane lipopolysaccharide assembly protein LptE/RlpB